MSHAVTITRTTVATSGTAVIINTGYLGTLPGLLKLAQLILLVTTIAAVIIVGFYSMSKLILSGITLRPLILRRGHDFILLLGAACVGVVAYYIDHGNGRILYVQKPELFYLLVATTFLIGTFCLLTSCLVSLSSATMISRTIYEVIYHGFAFILYLCAGLTLLIEVNHMKDYYRKDYEAYLAAAIMGLVLAGLYLLSTFLANRHYRGF